MPRKLLNRAIWSQVAGGSKAKETLAYDVEGVKQRILSPTRKDLPEWAVPFSTRRRFSTSIASKKDEKESILRTASISLDGESQKSLQDNDDNSFQILLEWKAMRSRLQVRPPEKPAILPPAAPLPPTFFDSNTATVIDRDTTKTKVTLKTRKVPLWISQINYGLLSSVTQECMQDIKAGERDLKKLATKFLLSIHEPKAIAPSREICLEQIQLYILAQWIARVDKALFGIGKEVKPTFTRVCLEISSRLYQSFLRREASPIWTSASEHANLRSVQQATLYRLFDIAYSCASQMESANQSVVKQALMLMTLVLQDTRLRPAQSRHLSRKYLEKLATLTEMTPACRNNGRLWHMTTDTFSHLVTAGAITALPSSTSSKEPVLDVFIRLMCLARSKRHISRSRIHKLLLQIVCKIQEVAAEVSLPARDSKTVSLSIESIFAGLSFVSTTTLEEIATLLHRSGDRLLSRDLAFMAPQEQRTLLVLTTLMRNWSNVVPFTGTVRPLASSNDARILGHRRCITSEKVWSEAIPLLDKRDPMYDHKLYAIFGARMASHARSKAPALVIADLDYLQKLNNDDLSRENIMALLPEKGQIDAMRAFLRSGMLIKATKMANEMAMQKKDDFKVKIMNVLFSGDLRLRMRSDVIMSRRQFAILLRRRTIVKAQRLYLRHAINRYFRSMKQVTLKMSTTSSKKRLYRFYQSLQSLDRFAIRHRISPNEQTSLIISHAIDRMSRHVKYQRSTLRELLYNGSLDLQRQTVSEVVKKIKAVLVTV